MGTPLNNRNEQNGRPPPPLPTTESDSQTNQQNNAEKKEICRNFVWGSCNKNTQCKFRHELDFEEMKKILKFCHDHQNLSGCTREHCTYLHTSKDEESLFFSTGTLPRVLAQRHASMAAAAAETIPQIALFIQESFMGPPPPPPSLPAPVASSTPVASNSLPPQRASVPVVPIQQLPPPPPPPTVPSPSVQQQAPIFTAPAAPAVPVFSMTQPPPPISSLPVFDASKPPPPITTPILPKSNQLKRHSPIPDAPSKKMKKDDGKETRAYCDQCVLRNISIDEYRILVDTIYSEEEYKTLIYKGKLEKFQKAKEMLSCIVSKDLYGIIENSIEGVPQIQVQDMFTQFNQTSFVSGASSSSKPILLQLLEYFMENSRYEMLSPTTSQIEDKVSQNLTVLLKKENSISSSSPDVLQALVEIMKHTNGMNGLERSAELTASKGGLFESRYSGKETLRPAPAPAPQPPSYPPYSAPPPGPSRHYYPPPTPMPAVSAVSLMSRPPPPAPPAPSVTCVPYATSLYQQQFFRN